MLPISQTETTASALPTLTDAGRARLLAGSARPSTASSRGLLEAAMVLSRLGPATKVHSHRFFIFDVDDSHNIVRVGRSRGVTGTTLP